MVGGERLALEGVSGNVDGGGAPVPKSCLNRAAEFNPTGVEIFASRKPGGWKEVPDGLGFPTEVLPIIPLS